MSNHLCVFVCRLFHKHMLQSSFTHRQRAGGERCIRSEESCSKEAQSRTGYPHGTGVCACSEVLASVLIREWIFPFFWSILPFCHSSGDPWWNDILDQNPLQSTVRWRVGRTWDRLHPLHAEGGAIAFAKCGLSNLHVNMYSFTQPGVMV